LFASHGVVLGTWHGRTLRYNGDAHTLMVAPSGSGKTQSLCIPTALTWQHSLFLFDPKGELFPASAAWRSTFSTVIRLDPTSPTSDCYDPLGAIRLGTDHEIRDTSLVTGIIADPDGEPVYGGAAQHFRELTIDFLNAVVIHGLYTRQATTLAQLDDFFLREANLALIIKEMGATAHTTAGVHPAVRRGINILKRLADRELSGVCSTASRALRITLDPLVARMVSTSDFAMRDLRERARPISLYLTVPYSDMERLRPLSRLITRQVLDYTTQHLGGWRHRMLLLIDEFQALNHFPAIPNALNFVRGYGLNLALITPSLNEIDRLYGASNNVLENSHVRVMYTPNDPKIAERFSTMTGTVEVEKTREAVAHDPGRVFGGRTTVSTSTERERLFDASQVAFMPTDTGLLLVGHGGYPALIKKAPAYKNRRMQQRMQGVVHGRSTTPPYP